MVQRVELLCILVLDKLLVMVARALT
jgi:hypothetical protein